MRRAASQWPVRAISRSSAHAHLCGRLIAHLSTCAPAPARCVYGIVTDSPYRRGGPVTEVFALRGSWFAVLAIGSRVSRLAFVVRFVVLWLRLPFALLAVVAGHWSLVTGRRGSWFGVCVRVAFLTEYCVLAFVRPVFCVVRVPAVGSLHRSRFSSHSHPHSCGRRGIFDAFLVVLGATLQRTVRYRMDAFWLFGWLLLGFCAHVLTEYLRLMALGLNLLRWYFGTPSVDYGPGQVETLAVLIHMASMCLPPAVEV